MDGRVVVVAVVAAVGLVDVPVVVGVVQGFVAYSVLAERIGDKTATIGTIDKFKFLIATGKVNIVQGDREANCGRAEVYPREDKIVLTDKPVVIDHDNGTVATGDVIEMLRGQRRVTSSNVHVTFPAIKNLGYDKNAPAPKPDVTPAPTTPAPSTAP